MKPRLFILPLAAASLAFAPFMRADNEVGFIEKFALAPDREAVLSQLVPGSEDYYFYSALHFQNTKQKDKLAAVTDQWAERFPRSTQRKIIENRAALINYETDPQATLKFLRERLNLQFNHQQEARDKKPDLPAALDGAKVARSVFQAEALKHGDDLGQFSEAALEALVREKVALKQGQTRTLLGRLNRPDVPGLLDLITANLKTKESGGFGEFGIHRALLPDQLDELAKRIPALLESQAFVYARLRKLAPSADADAEYDMAEREAWFERATAYVQKLSPVFNSLKANLLFRRLQHDRARGIYNRERFLEYLKLPRPMGYMNPKFLEEPRMQRNTVDLGMDFSEALIIAPPINNDEALIRDYFLHIFAAESKGAEDGWQPYAQWVREAWLKPVYAEAMVTNGIGSPEKWAALLSPTAFQQLKDRVDVNFTPTNPPLYAPADEVSLDVVIKNAPKVIVKIYEINALSYFLGNQRQLNTDLPLEGLVANRELTHDFSGEEAGRNPFRSTGRTFKFPELKGQRGAWVIEFIGGGKSSRALVRKGQWSLLQQVGPGGDLLTVIDETRKPVAGAVAWLDGRRLVADEKSGQIVVPFTQEPGNKPIILADAAGGFATLTSFEHHAEQYTLDAQFNVEREQLLAGRDATIAIRTSLLLHQAKLPLELLKDAKLTITSTTLDGVATTTEVKEPKLEALKDFTHTIRVPDRLTTLRVLLTGAVEKLSAGGEKVQLAREQTWSINGIDRTARTSAAFLSRFDGKYFFELLGKNGEPLVDRQVVFDFTHREFSGTVTIPLRTDEKGRVELGALAGLAKVRASGADQVNGSWELKDAERTWPAAINARAGEEIRVPWTGSAAPQRVSLLETRAGTFVDDRSEAIVKQGEGAQAVSAFTIKGLTPGDYSLRLDDHTFEIRVTAGDVVRNWIVSPNRELEVINASPLNIATVTVEGDKVVIQLTNPGPATRVHVAATRFLGGENLFSGLGDFARFDPRWTTSARNPNLYTAGREIGDEYRYILERRYAKLFPGNMLPRPGLLLNPWDLRSTDLQALAMAAREAAGRMGEGRGSGSGGGGSFSLFGNKGGPQDGDGSPDIDFLASTAPVLYNLVPDEKGIVRIDRKALGDRQDIQVFAGDLNSAVWRTLSLPEVPTKFQDLRLARILDPLKPFTEKKEITVLAAGQSLTLADILTSEIESYDSLASIHSLLTTLNSDGNLAKFAWVLQWPKMKDEEKQAKYSEFACHELNFFLARKDPDFFQKVVQPYLRNKKDRTFMDDYLLGADLRSYVEPWTFSQLNMAERALLGQRLPAETASVARHLKDLWELLPPDPTRQTRLFDTGLRGRAMQAGEPGGSPRESFARDKNQALAETPPAAPMPAPVKMPGSNVTGAAKVQKKAEGADFSFAGAPVTADEAAKKMDEPADGAMRNEFKVSAKDSLGADGYFENEEAVSQRQAVRQFFRALGPTKEWAENNYYRLPIAQQNATLIQINAFWRDYATWDGKTPFVSKNIAEAARNFPEMMLALAVLDLPFEAPKHTTRSEGGQFTLTAAGPVIVFHQEIKPATPAAGNVELLVSQNFYRNGDRYREEGNEKFDKYVTGEFLAGVVYGANIVVTNPTSSPQKLDVLMQIPQGALPVLNSKATQSREVRIEAYTTQTFTYAFYFPLTGAQPFVQYPVNVARNEQAVGAAKPFTFKVVQQLSEVDKTAWDYVSQYGTDAEVFAYLEKANLSRTELARIAWRARQSADFFRKLVAVLAQRHVYSDVIYSYAVVHNDAAALGEWLQHRNDFISQCGPWLSTKLVSIDPVERRIYQQLEYSPLVNQRTYRIGGEAKIANPMLRGQYQSLLRILAYKPTLEAMDQMSVVYYLFLQDRVEEALARFHAIKAEALPTRLQHDYFRCYAAFYEEQLGVARGVANQYANYSVDRWKKIFAEVTSQLDEIEGKAVPPTANPADGPKERETQQGELAATEPSFDFKVENRQIALTWKNLREVTVNYYLMDPEFLFSSSPFVTQDPGRFSIIKPSKSSVEKLPEGKDALELPLPGEFAKANVLVEILGAGQRKAQAYHANTLKLTLAENYGRLELRDQAAGKAISKAYVKVYARLNNGTIRFFKDGNTDLRGKFDYASLNSADSVSVPPPQPRPMAGGASLGYQMLAPSELNSVEKLSILIISEEHGTLIREANPPAQ